MSLNIKSDGLNLGITDRCCIGTTGCEWDGTLRRVRTEPIYVQKVYDATLVQLQALSTVNNVRFSPSIGRGSRIVRVIDIRCRKFFNPNDIEDPRNLVVEPETILSGGQFVKNKDGSFVEVIGPDGFPSQKLIFANTSECDSIERGTPVFGTQRIFLRGNVFIEIDVLVQDSRGRKNTITLTSNVPIAPAAAPIVLTNFFELCVPSVFDSAFFPRFAEFCSVLCETRLATNSISRDIRVCPESGEVRIDLIIAICISCEKKIIVPVQLCVLSTGFTQLSPETSPICSTFPGLFPKQIDEDSIGPNPPSPRPPCHSGGCRDGASVRSFELEEDYEMEDYEVELEEEIDFED